MRKLVVAIGLLVCSSSSAFSAPAADPTAEPVAPEVAKQDAPPLAPALVGAPPSTLGPPSQAEDPAVEAAMKHKGRLDEGTALALSLGGTLGGWAVTVASVKAGSATTLWLGAAGILLGPNAGHWYRGAAVTRGLGLRLLGVATTVYAFFRLEYCENNCDRHELFLYGGALLFAGGTIDDIVRAPLKVREHNQRLEGLSIAPMVTDRGGGLAIGGRF